LATALGLAPTGPWQGALCSYGTLVAVMQAAEGALRRSGLHRSADDFQMLLTTFFTKQRHAGLIQGEPVEASPAQLQSRPTLRKSARTPRRIPGLSRKLL